MANYVNAVRTGNLLYLAGKGPGLPGHPLPVGKVGRDFTKEQGYEHARQTGLSLIAVMKAELGDLDRVKRIVKLLGMVNATPEFGEQPEVINGCSDLFVSVFGDRGRHARSAVGMGSLPRGIPVEIEVIVEVERCAAGVPPPKPAAKPPPRAGQGGSQGQAESGQEASAGRAFDRPLSGLLSPRVPDRKSDANLTQQFPHRPRRARAFRPFRRPLRRRNADAADPRSGEGLQRGQGRSAVPGRAELSP